MDIYKFWAVKDKPPKTPDCFVVLSYAVTDSENPTLPTRAIIDLTVRWWKKFPTASIIMSTGDNQKLGVPNSKVMIKYAAGLGVPRAKLIEENRSIDTYQNLIFSREIINRRKFRYVTIVTYDLHTRRMLKIARKLGLSGFSYISAGGKGGPAYGIKTYQTHSRTTIFIYEIIAYVYNRLRGEL